MELFAYIYIYLWVAFLAVGFIVLIYWIMAKLVLKKKLKNPNSILLIALVLLLLGGFHWYRLNTMHERRQQTTEVKND